VRARELSSARVRPVHASDVAEEVDEQLDEFGAPDSRDATYAVRVSTSSASVMTDTPTHRPSCPPMSANS